MRRLERRLRASMLSSRIKIFSLEDTMTTLKTSSKSIRKNQRDTLKSLMIKRGNSPRMK